MDQTAAKRNSPQAPEDMREHPDNRHHEGPKTAKLFVHGRSQAVRLPKEFRFPGKEVRIHREGNRVILEPVETDFKAWLAKLDAIRGDEPFLPEGRPEQPPMPPGDEIDFDK